MKRRNEVLVGMVLAAATAVAVLGTLWLARGGLRSGYPLFTSFEWGQSLKQGQPVTLAGVSVGFVNDVELREGGYLDVRLSIDQDRKIPEGSSAVVMPVGIFGDVEVALLPPKPLRGTYYQAGDTVPAGPPVVSLSQIFARVDSIGRSVQILASSLRREMVDAGGLADIRRSISMANRTMESASGLVLEINDVVAVQNRNLTTTLGAFQRATSALDSSRIAATVANIERTTANAATLTQELSATTRRLNSLVGRLEGGDGTAGKLLTDTLLYRDIRSLVTRMDSLTADFQRNPRKYINLEVF